MRIVGRIPTDEYMKPSRYQEIIDAIMQTPVGENFTIECDTKEEANRYRNRVRDLVNAKEILVRTRLIEKDGKYLVVYIKINNPTQ